MGNPIFPYVHTSVRALGGLLQELHELVEEFSAVVLVEHAELHVEGLARLDQRAGVIVALARIFQVGKSTLKLVVLLKNN